MILTLTKKTGRGSLPRLHPCEVAGETLGPPAPRCVCEVVHVSEYACFSACALCWQCPLHMCPLVITGASDRQLLIMRGATVQVLSRPRTQLSCVLPVPFTCSLHVSARCTRTALQLGLSPQQYLASTACSICCFSWQCLQAKLSQRLVQEVETEGEEDSASGQEAKDIAAAMAASLKIGHCGPSNSDICDVCEIRGVAPHKVEDCPLVKRLSGGVEQTAQKKEEEGEWQQVKVKVKAAPAKGPKQPEGQKGKGNTLGQGRAKGKQAGQHGGKGQKGAGRVLTVPRGQPVAR